MGDLWYKGDLSVIPQTTNMEGYMTICMIECGRCENFFKPGDNGQVVCNSCTKEEPGFAYRARLAAQYKPPKKEDSSQNVDDGWGPMYFEPEEEAWFHKSLADLGQ